MSDESTSMEVDMILGDQSSATEANHNYVAFQLSLECAKNEYLTDKDRRATYYLGGICCLMPELTDDILEAVRSMGRRVRTICFPSAATRNGLILPPKNVEPKKVMALFGYLVIMLYKNGTEANFRKFSENRLKALFRVTGFTLGEEEDMSVFNGEEHSTYFRTTYGQNHEIRKAVLDGILNRTEDTDSFGGVCSYVAKFLEFIDMAEFFITLHTLSDSPVLRVPKLADEVKNLERARDTILDKERPQYYMILENPEARFILDNSNFPTLAAVALKVRTNTQISEVDYYVAMHRNQ